MVFTRASIKKSYCTLCLIVVIALICLLLLQTDHLVYNEANLKPPSVFNMGFARDDVVQIHQLQLMQEYEEWRRHQEHLQAQAPRYVSTNTSNHEILTPEQLEARFEFRKNLLKKGCEARTTQVTSSSPFKSNILPIAHDRLRMCLIPKVGTTFFRGLQAKEFSASSKRSHAVVGAYSGNPKMFFIAREPYSRMVSGYLGKLFTNPLWFESHGKYIVKKFRSNATHKSKACGNDVTFAEFVKYVIDADKTQIKLNAHFMPLRRQCKMCEDLESFDYILHLETLKEDIQHVFNTVNISLDIEFTNEINTIKNKVRSYFKDHRSKPRMQSCEGHCSILQKMWWSFQARGLISKNISMIVTGDECAKISPEEFNNMALDANTMSANIMNKSVQKREFLVEMYRTVPLRDRLRLRDTLMEDFVWFGYDPTPKDIFPEFVQS